ncbi:non-hydrolyzing UDP-N-acetylglucosamine 2-epimerase [Azospirillum agricola]|uniref:non-hydrolyzing UDP-N-acetylglucosamine 2-epimerase n=1 Tax=Azospirillum agricola TaxID=1720247 RepID=UPI0015C49555|nr:UDP-N-acetylglucosamine 2-epimerase (non-hydrolyzing) [Azospirillum agricola]
MRILTIVGARPQFIKAAEVGRALAAAGLEEILVHTGQHFDAAMSDVFFADLCMPPPAHNLYIHGGGNASMTGRMLQALEPLLDREKPDWVLVYGDTNSTLAGALAAAHRGIPVAHVEAGLRSFNRAMPEELNRVMTDHLSTLLLCPTPAAVANLQREGIAAGVYHVGDVMYASALSLAGRARRTSTVLDRLGVHDSGFSLATVHRAENTNDSGRLASILAYLRDAAAEEKVPIILPLHPRTRDAAARFGLDLGGLTVLAPVGALDMARLLAGCTRVFTDSGGVQKEAYFHGKPCITLRDETEWVETIENGWNRLWRGPGYRPRRPIADYGDGQAASRIAALLAGGAG